MPKILVSAGHTLMDPGAIFQDLREVDLARKIALLVIPHLQNAGKEVLPVPLDLPLWQRLEWINQNAATTDLLIEVHINDADGTKRGIEVWYKGEGENESQKLAHAIAETVKKKCGYQIQGVRSEREHELGQLTFLTRSQPTPVLVEALYLDNEEDIKDLKDGAKLDQLAQALAAGVLAYLGEDLQGKPISDADKVDFSNLKPYVAPNKLADGVDDDLGLDDLDFGLGGFSGMPQPGASSTSASPSAVPFTPASSSSPAPLMMDRKQREEMVTELYTKFLGRKPTSQDLSFFVNQGVDRYKLIDKMVDSQEHQDMIKAKRDVEEMKQKLTSAEMQIKRLENQMQDQGQLFAQLQGVMRFKDQEISRMDQELTKHTGKPGRVSAGVEVKGEGRDKVAFPRKRKLRERFFGFFSRRLS